LVTSLASAPAEVLALTRNPDAGQLPSGTQAVGIDFDQPSSLERALRDADRLFITHGTAPRQPANEIALIDAAVRVGVRHIVKLSVLGPPSRSHPADWHMEIEAHLASKDVGYTVLRPSAYADVLRRSAASIAGDFWGGAAGSGRTNFIDTRDVADVARVALLDAKGIESRRAFHLTGPQAWTMQEVAAELSHLLGRPVRYADRTPSQQRAALTAAGLSDFVAELLLGLDVFFRDSAFAETTTTVEQLTGHAPRPLTHWLAENISLFTR
jgi:uncharacterized protein YbjT (DUF2867 family)